MKQRVSALTAKSEKRLIDAMDLSDLRELAILSSQVVQGLKPVCEFRSREEQMITKYGFKVKEA